MLDESGDAASETGGVNAGPQIEEEVIERQGLDVDTPGDEKILHPCRWKDVDDVVSIHIGRTLRDGVKKIVSLSCREKGERLNGLLFTFMLRKLSHSRQVDELRVLEDVCDSKVNLFFARCSDYLHSSNRVPTQLEEAIL